MNEKIGKIEKKVLRIKKIIKIKNENKV